jgi:hypothetical protein
VFGREDPHGGMVARGCLECNAECRGAWPPGPDLADEPGTVPERPPDRRPSLPAKDCP